MRLHLTIAQRVLILASVPLLFLLLSVWLVFTAPPRFHQLVAVACLVLFVLLFLPTPLAMY